MGVLFSIGCALTWSVGTICFKKCGERSHPLAMTLYECLIGFLILLPGLWLLEGMAMPDGVGGVTEALSMTGPLVISALFGTVIGGFLFLKTLQMIGASYTAILECLYGPLVILGSYLFLGEALQWVEVIGASLIFIAMILISLDLPREKVHSRRIWAGIGVGIVCQICLAVSVLSMKPLLGTFPVVWIVLFRYFVAIFTLLGVVSLLKDRRKILTSIQGRKNRAFFVSGAIFCAVFATVLWVAGMKYSQVSVSAILIQLSTVFTVIFASIFLSEKLSTQKVIATFVAFLGACLFVV